MHVIFCDPKNTSRTRYCRAYYMRRDLDWQLDLLGSNTQLYTITTESLRTLSVSQLTTEYLTTTNSSARGLLARARNLLPRTGFHN
jgi:hypothetical protein